MQSNGEATAFQLNGSGEYNCMCVACDKLPKQQQRHLPMHFLVVMFGKAFGLGATRGVGTTGAS